MDKPANNQRVKVKKIKHRVQIDFSEKRYKQLLAINEQLEHSSVARTIRQSVAFYEFYLETVRKGDEFCIRRSNGEIETIAFIV